MTTPLAASRAEMPMPCPFCGRTPLPIYGAEHVRCRPDCIMYECGVLNVSLWNRRASPPIAAQRVERDDKVLRCAFCDAEYPPGTPPTQHAALTAHVFVCPKHPMRLLDAVLEAARIFAPAEVRPVLYAAAEANDDKELNECANLARALDAYDRARIDAALSADRTEGETDGTV